MYSKSNIRSAVLEYIQDTCPEQKEKYERFLLMTPYEMEIHENINGETESFVALVIMQRPIDNPDRIIYVLPSALLFGCADGSLLINGKKHYFEYSASYNLCDTFKSSELEDFD